MADRRVVHTIDSVSYHHPFQERQPSTVEELPHAQPNMPPLETASFRHNVYIISLCPCILGDR